MRLYKFFFPIFCCIILFCLLRNFTSETGFEEAPIHPVRIQPSVIRTNTESVISEASVNTPKIRKYRADIIEGNIGVADSAEIDEPFDNLFHIILPEIKPKNVVFLEYELFGVESQTGVARSINDGQAVGGQFVVKNSSWTYQREEVSLQLLKKGDNVIRFGMPAEARLKYKVRNVRFLIVEQTLAQTPLIINGFQGEVFGGKVYVKGVIQNCHDRQFRLFCNNRVVPVWRGEFEFTESISENELSSRPIEVKMIFSDGTVLLKELNPSKKVKEFQFFLTKPRGVRTEAGLLAGKMFSLQLEKEGASLMIPAGALYHNRSISITALRDVDIPSLNADLVNVTASSRAFRFLPHGSQFQKDALVVLPFDSTLIPEGYTAKDIQTFYFNEDSRTWEALPLDTVEADKGVVRARTTHFTDMINGIIKVPESPQTKGYTPTSIKDLKAADPSAGIHLMAPPRANNNGSASLDFALKLPAGRAGLTPSLTLQYSNQAGNSWTGLGWALSSSSIGIDTRWGAARYHSTLETETYLVNGQQLAPVAHRGTLNPRTADKVFRLRVEGSFQRIIRHGSNPTNYWWEVTSKDGTRNFYGGTPSSGISNTHTLKDAFGNVGYWALAETRDADNNFIRYAYDLVADVGVVGGNVLGQQLYLSRVIYTGHGTIDGAYQVELLRDRQLGEQRRSDIDINGTLGFKMVTADLLRKVNITFKGQPVRSYEFKYQSGVFKKTLLQSVDELDASGALFYQHSFDYFNDLVGPQGSNYFGSPEDRSPGNDNIKGDIINSVPGFTGEGSALSTSKSSNVGGGLALTIGSSAANFWSKLGTVGGSFGYSSDKAEGLVSMVDINGDGLPDKVYKKNNNLFYRANQGMGAQPFGPQRQILGLTNFSQSNSKNTSWGVQIIPLIAYFGRTTSNTTSTTSVYFTDFNGDGLTDIAANGRVFFNRINSAGDPEFLPTSTGTPSPIVTGSSVSNNFLAPDLNQQAEQEAQFPLQDIVRFWEAPFTGTVRVMAPVRLMPVSTQTGVVSLKKDGVRTSIQHSGSVLWSTTIQANDFSVKNPTGVGNLNVVKGQRIYFRVESIYNGEEDLVEWNPEIQYLSTVIPAIDANGKRSDFYKASSDFVLDSRSQLRVGKDGTIRIDGQFSKGITSDTITAIVTKTPSSGLPVEVFRQSYACSTLVTSPIVIPSLMVTTGESLKFELHSDTYIDRSIVQWIPHYQYTSFTDNTPVVNSAGQPTLEGKVMAQNQNYNDWMRPTSSLTVNYLDTVRVAPLVSGLGSATGSLTFTVKGLNAIHGKRVLQLAGGVIVGNILPIEIVRRPGQPLFVEYTSADRGLANSLVDLKFITSKDTSYLDSSQNLVQLTLRDTLDAGLYTEPAVDYLGTLFRGWGQFAFKGKTNFTPLDETKINLNEFNNYPTDPNQFTDSSTFNLLQDPSKTNFIQLFANAETGFWMGYDTAVYVAPALMSSARLWMHDVSVDSIMAGASISAVNKVTTTKTTSNALGLSAGFSATRTISRSTTTSILDMMDMNGDRYPDVVNENSIQYTLPNGELEAAVRPHGLGPVVNQGNSDGLSLGGGSTAVSAGISTLVGARTEQRQAFSSIGLSGNTGSSDDETVSAWTDVNGDGLTDKVFRDGRVALSLGYRFAPSESWGFSGIDKNGNKSTGAGLGVTIDVGSIQGGFGLSRGTGASSSSLQDVNSDGLPDKITLAPGGMNVQLNTGNGLSSAVFWPGFDKINTNISTGESVNAAFTIPINIPIIFIKICINPSFSTGHGVSRRLEQVMDFDGDGLPDLLRSNNDGHLTIAKSLVGRTNLLKKVTRPMGGYFTIDYTRVGNTYNLPQSKWVMNELEVVDGLAGDGADTIRTKFTYEGGVYERHERDFFGFDKVITEQVNTLSNNLIYRRQIQKFLNASYYTKGLLESEWMENAAGNKYVQTNHVYHLRNVQDSCKYPALVRTVKLYFEGQTSVGASTFTDFDYDAFGNVTRIQDVGDGSPEDLMTATVTYHDLNAPYIKSVPSSISVVTADGEKRRRTTVIDNSGNITRIRQFLANGLSADTDMEYDQFGNLSKITRPANHKGERMWYRYVYDNVVNSYITNVTDAFGYSSQSTYDFRFGEVTGTVSMNGEAMQYLFDSKGRLARFRGPYEIASGKPYTILYEYFPQAVVPMAITRNFDPEHNADIRTITFMDGLGRPVQVKKQSSIFRGSHQEDEVKMIVSGKNIYDAFGRAVQTYYPTTEPIGAGNILYTPLQGQLTSTTTYDVQDRQLSQVLADGATTRNIFSITSGLFSTRTVDALNNSKEVWKDVKERNRKTSVFGGPNGTITTEFFYNALSELLKVVDVNNNHTLYTYDNLGRRLTVKHPDAGLTEMTYDLAGNLMEKKTPQIRKEIPNGGAIKYAYEYERLTEIDYPRYYQNKVKYVYGDTTTKSRAGRVMLVVDASGGQEFFYGKLGEVTKTIRTVMVSPVYAVTYVSEQEYDTWNRIKKMVYPDGEVVTYKYNKGGSLHSFSGKKLGNDYSYVAQMGYDEYEQRVYLRQGNGTETHYQYDPLRRRLSGLQVHTVGGRTMMNNRYVYDAVSNILQITNNGMSDSSGLGGFASHEYQYDNLYRLIQSKGVYRGGRSSNNYRLEMSYDNLYNVVRKKMTDSLPGRSYDQLYAYNGPNPHQPTEIGGEQYRYDANGNWLGSTQSENFWDEENRLIAVLKSGVLSRYTYDANGERVLKSSGGIQGIWVNGAPAGAIKHGDNFTAYVSPYLVARKDGFTKHYYIESQRVTSKLGQGRFSNITFPSTGLTAGGIDYLWRANQIERARTQYYAGLGVSPGPPTDKNFWARPENSGIAAPVYIDSSAAAVPPGWPSNPAVPNYGQPIVLPSLPSRDSVRAGYGFDGTGHLFERNQYFYHPDHLGSTSFITDMMGEVSQHAEYSGFGETFVDEHATSSAMPYLFNGKEKDVETGLYYYGARYYDARLSVWMSVDPKTEKLPSLSPYNFCMENPVKMVDPDGKFANVVIGGIIGGGLELAFQSFDDKPINWTNVGIATAAGALTSGASAIEGAGMRIALTKFAANRAVDIGESVGKQMMKSENDGKSIKERIESVSLVQTATDVGSNIIAEKATKGFDKIINLKTQLYQVDHAKRVHLGDPKSSGRFANYMKAEAKLNTLMRANHAIEKSASGVAGNSYQKALEVKEAQ